MQFLFLFVIYIQEMILFSFYHSHSKSEWPEMNLKIYFPKVVGLLVCNKTKKKLDNTCGKCFLDRNVTATTYIYIASRGFVFCFLVSTHEVLVHSRASHSKWHNIIIPDNQLPDIGNSSSIYNGIWMDQECILVAKDNCNLELGCKESLSLPKKTFVHHSGHHTDHIATLLNIMKCRENKNLGCSHT